MEASSSAVRLENDAGIASDGVLTSADVDNFDFTVGNPMDRPPLLKFHELEDLRRFVQRWAVTHGYKLPTGNSGGNRNVYLRCSLAGEDSKKPQSDRQRMVSGHKPTAEGCQNFPWEIRIKDHLHHNHGPMDVEYQVLHRQMDPALADEAVRMASLGGCTGGLDADDQLNASCEPGEKEDAQSNVLSGADHQATASRSGSDTGGCATGSILEQPPSGQAMETADVELPSDLEQMIPQVIVKPSSASLMPQEWIANPAHGPDHQAVLPQLVAQAKPSAQEPSNPTQMTTNMDIGNVLDPIVPLDGPRFLTCAEDGACLPQVPETNEMQPVVPATTPKRKRIRPKRIYKPKETVDQSGPQGAPSNLQSCAEVTREEKDIPCKPPGEDSKYNPPGYGNCGYSCIAHVLAGEKPESPYSKPDGWLHVRRDLLHELHQDPAHWSRKFGGDKQLKLVCESLEVPEGSTHVPCSKWLARLEMGPVIANAYNRPIVFVTGDVLAGCITNLPTLHPPPPKPLGPIFLAFTGGNHWELVVGKQGLLPIPPPTLPRRQPNILLAQWVQAIQSNIDLHNKFKTE
ncbi:uncharacterized protein PGTG_06992 [Puccinia graminis f. sp. tritici CRL 75-36-700-3]|uniref:OTU domain-containing protein n=1 Tax=Puccinia graminis f. sp. tritici (strain CRL 75-36-700-3 / race SCCL) TaxID=418459 RepID=E3KAZ2_PUCGT|nr:uncharacterized protein PGTG_06992 [Puccinia graminis f. sp. tritici CRL 75-36-700-3]EFP81371.2 hypothetical protein PGTG_06992 [Puccinia graminis f. sp. tritici CRL 75-36-700-3]